MTDPDLAKLSEASEQCGIPTDILKLLATDELLPQTVRGKAGHVYFPQDAVPTGISCRARGYCTITAGWNVANTFATLAPAGAAAR